MITVNELVAARAPELAVSAGQGGGDRVISWAHVCDLPDPWVWVRPGDLVMTTGDGLPADPEEQREWFSALADVGVSGFVLAPRPGAPSPSPTMLTVADDRSVPLVTADFSLEFAGLARTVIESVVQSEREHIATARRLFDVYSEALRTRSDLSGRLDAVARSVGWSINVVRGSDGVVVATGGAGDGTGPPITVPVPGPIRADVQVGTSTHRLLDGSLVHYLAGLVGIELEHLARAGRERARRGRVVLRGYLDGSIGSGQLRHEVAERAMGETRLVLARIEATATPCPSQVDWVPAAERDVEPLIADDGEGGVLVLAPEGWPGLDALRERVAPDARVGLSAPFVAGAGPVDALLQARMAAERARESGRTVARYDQLDDPSGIGPRSADEMRSLVGRVLGPVLEHDRITGADLVDSLEVFLRHDRSWTRTAAALGVHRQTLVYRIRQVERLTGLKPTSTDGVTRLWIALHAARASGTLPSAIGRPSK